MPLKEIRDVTSHTRLGLWRMDEQASELTALFPHLRALPMPYKHEVRQREFYAIRALLATMTGDTTLHIDYLPSGKPVVKGWHLSISHTRGYAALMLSGTEEVAVDIEKRGNMVTNIADRFIRTDEVATTVEEMLALWSAKETLYKLHSEDNLHYFDMRLVSQSPTLMRMENMKRGVTVDIHHELTADYVLTYHPADSRSLS